VFSSIAYYVTSMRLDVQDRISNKEIRQVTRESIIKALEASNVALRPLQKELYQLLKSLAREDLSFRAAAYPLLRIGPARCERFAVEQSP
jgi:hypothetical protein